MMAKAPKDPRDVFTEITEDYRNLFADDLLSIVLYGSATGAGYRPGKSDINFMIQLSENGIEQLDRAFETVSKWRKRNVAVPLFLTPSYLETSLDVFPVEYLTLQNNYTLVYGEDILKDLTFQPEHVRLQCEREIKGKLLLLRQAFLETGGKGRALKEVIGKSIMAFIAIFQALLFLKGPDIPSEPRDVLGLGGRTLEIDGILFEKLLDIKEEKISPDDGELKRLFADYMKEVRKLSKIVDTLGG
jgi:hypothetical protein